MAGIGFELKKVLQKGGLARFLTVGLAGTAIVAGPWLLSVLAIFLIQRFAAALLAEHARLFMTVIVYCYASSLVLASGFHYVFTRLISDHIYEHEHAEAGSALLAFLILAVAASAAIGAAGTLPMRLPGVVPRPGLFAFAAVILFVAVNLNWIVMSFISLLKEYLAILLVYVGGSLASVLGVLLLGRPLSVSGSLLGYALGQCATAVALYSMTLRRYRPSRLPFGEIFDYLGRYRWLFLSGLLYAWSTWVDKAVFWYGFGTKVPGSWMAAFDPYDIPVFFTILTLIPSLVYFTIETETSFYPRLRAFLKSLNADSHRVIQEKKYAMIRTLRAGIREQAALQGICTLIVLIAAPLIAKTLSPSGSGAAATLRLTGAAVFFHALFLCLMIFLFYFELYRQAFAATGIFFAVNLLASLTIVWCARSDLVGLSYLLGGLSASAAAAFLLSRSAPRMERILFTRSSKRS